MKVYETMKAKVEKLTSDFEAEKNRRYKDIETTQEKVLKAEKKMNAASDAGDVSAYSKAKAEKKDAEDAIEMYQIRLQKLNGNEPLVSREEYEADSKALKAELAEMCLKDKKEIISLCDQIKAIADRNAAAIADANEVLRRYQTDVFHNFDRRTKDQRGKYYIQPGTENQFTDNDIIAFADHITDNDYPANGFYTRIKEDLAKAGGTR